MPRHDLNLQNALEAQKQKLANAGTSAGAKKGWETKKIGGDPVAESPWNGHEYHGPGGRARVIDIPGDEARQYHSMTHNGLIKWSVNLPKSVPAQVHDAALRAAIADADGGTGTCVAALAHARNFIA